MKTDAKLSIIIPVYNGEKFIAGTIDSILHSTYRNLEILLIDDGSTDDSLALCRKYASSDSRIKVFHKKNGGVAEARNYGLEHATGEYIGFCDQDDEVSGEMYHKMMNRLSKDGSQAAICGCYRKKKSGEKVIFEKYTDAVLDRPLILEKLLLPMLFKGFDAYGNPEIDIYSTIWNCIIAKDLIVEKNLRFFSFVNYEDDLIMLLQLLMYADRISTLSDILYYWNTNISSEMHRSAKRYIKDLEERQERFLNYVVKQLKENGIPPKTISEFVYIQQCRNALLQLDNLAASKNRKTLQQIKELKNCTCISHIQSASTIIAPQKGFVRNTAIIPLLRRKKIVLAYSLNQMIDFVRFFVEKYHITEKMERRMKKGH
ncbi:MAG: glycosyltransferase [Lachnospiraceae bacterium]|nr:glycosyltransferase [Lachnospiraceae bacterium]